MYRLRWLHQWLHRWRGSTCAFCRLPAASGSLCQACRNDLPALGAVCAACAEPLAEAPRDGLTCARCQTRPPPWARCRAALPYAWPVDVALQRLKYSRELSFAAAFGELLAQMAVLEFQGVDALCPVPLHRWRHARRGFNQAEELARPLRRQSGLPLLHNVRRVRRTAPQSGLDRAARRRNLRNAFSLSGALHCRHPLVIDDIMTSGETCRQLAEVLLLQGAREVSVLVVARAAPVFHPGVPEKV